MGSDSWGIGLVGLGRIRGAEGLYGSDSWGRWARIRGAAGLYLWLGFVGYRARKARIRGAGGLHCSDSWGIGLVGLGFVGRSPCMARIRGV